MCLDAEYFKVASKNRGTVGEEIAYEFLKKVFGVKSTFKSVKVQSLKNEFATKERIDVTDIDVLCLLGSKALCVQIKSKKLTELSKSGDDEQLKKDFQGAVQDAYEQGLVSRKKMLEKNAKYFDENGREILLSEDLNEVYIMGITTENYPSLTHQVHTLLDKNNDDPFPIFSTIFDLELITHYLNDPYDFLYYIKQRTSLMDYFTADEEMVFLGYHLDQKLWESPKATMINISNDFGQLIDRNYYPYKAGIAVSDEGDAIKNRWTDVKFEKLCKELKEFNRAKITDILFYLFDLSGDARSNLVEQIILTKRKTLKDKKHHNFSVFPESEYSPSVGITYYSLNSDNSDELEKRVISLCQLRKYKNKGDIWIGFGSIINSDRMIDAIFFDEEPWEYDEKLEELSQELLGENDQKKYIRFGRKIGRNERCPCGSGLKYKNCCGNK